jgi:hypothetical protein
MMQVCDLQGGRGVEKKITRDQIELESVISMWWLVRICT